MIKVWQAMALLALLMTAAPAPLWAQQKLGPGAGENRYEVGKALPPAPEGAVIISLTLEQAVQRALEGNLDLQSARLSPRLETLSLRVSRAAFNPTFTTSFGYNNSSTQSTSQLDGGTRTTNERHNMSLGVSQPLPWFGGRFSTSLNNSRTETNNIFATRNPSFSSSLSLSYTQPLLSGLRIDNQRNQLRTAEIQADITDIQLRTQIANLSDQVRVAYWGMRAQIEQIEIQRLSLEQAEQLLENNRTRVANGRLAEIELVAAEAQVAAAEQALLNAEIQWRNQELVFKRLLANGPRDPIFGQTLNPIDLPTFAEEPEVDMEAAIQVALRERSDVTQQQQQRQITEFNLEVTRESLLPDVSLSTGYSLQGVGGNLFARSGLGGEPELIESGGYADGLRSIANFDTPAWNVSINFSYPLGMQAARANVERAELQLRQNELSMQALELQIVTEVTNAGLTVGNTLLQIRAATRSREAAERAADAELARFGVGASTNFQVVSVQNSLTSARLSELRALINHINAVAEFDRVQRVGR